MERGKGYGGMSPSALDTILEVVDVANQDAEVLPWVVSGEDAGTWVTARNLTYAKVIIPVLLICTRSDRLTRFIMPHIWFHTIYRKLLTT